MMAGGYLAIWLDFKMSECQDGRPSAHSRYGPVTGS